VHSLPADKYKYDVWMVNVNPVIHPTVALSEAPLEQCIDVSRCPALITSTCIKIDLTIHVSETLPHFQCHEGMKQMPYTMNRTKNIQLWLQEM